MLGRKSTTAIERAGSGPGSRAVEVVGEAASDFAERAVAAAQSAQRAATPVLRSAAEKSAGTLSHAAERAAVVLSDTAERLADSAEERGGQAAFGARHRIADASEALAVAVRPKKRHRIRRLAIFSVLAGAIVALVKSPLRSKLADRLFGAPPEFEDDTPESITLPSSTPSAAAAQPDAPTEQSDGGVQGEGAAGAGEEQPAAEAGGDANGVVTGSVNKGEGAKS